MTGERANGEDKTQVMNEDSIINQMDELAIKDAINRNMGFIREFLWILGEQEISENFEQRLGWTMLIVNEKYYELQSLINELGNRYDEIKKQAQTIAGVC